MSIGTATNPVWLIVECRMCEHIYEEKVYDKTTSVCPKCDVPMEVYGDGRTAPSALFEVRGNVSGDRYRRFGMGGGLFIRTREYIRKNFGF